MKARLADLQARERATHYARVLSPRGVYPAECVRFDSSYYIANDRLCFFTGPCAPSLSDAPFSEQHWMGTTETRAYGALMLSVDRERTYASIYPYPFSVALVRSKSFEHFDEVTSELEPLLVEELTAPDRLYPGAKVAAKNSYRTASDISPPTVVGGPKYDLRGDGIDYELAHRLFDAIQPSDALALRGIGTLVKAAMLSSHYQFFEEATNTLFIAMEASFRLVLRQLRAQGHKEPTARDAATFIHDAFFDVNRLEHYFEEDYERRITSFHPESRYGVYAYPELMADDYYFLFNDLLEVFRYLLVGYVHPSHLEKRELQRDGT